MSEFPNQSTIVTLERPELQESNLPSQEERKLLGGMAIAEGSESQPMHDLVIGGETYQTDLPEGINPFAENGKIDPQKIDEVPVGEFRLSIVRSGFDIPVHQENRAISIRSTENGKVINPSLFEGHIQIGAGKTGKLMEALGYEVDATHENDFITGIPTPGTLVAAAAKSGVDVELVVTDGQYINGRAYLGAFSKNKYPVSLGTEYGYQHDSEDDHMTAIVLAGKPLIGALAGVSIVALESDQQKQIDDIAQGIDNFTATLRAVISPSVVTGEAYGLEMGRRTLTGTGEKIGISAERVSVILKTAQENAQKLGIEVKELQ
jgi:hypothetical protein